MSKEAKPVAAPKSVAVAAKPTAAKAEMKPEAKPEKPAKPERKLPSTIMQPPKIVEVAPLPPPAYAPVASVAEGVHPAYLSALTYGLFAAINKSFGFHGQALMKHASLRILEFGQKRGWLPTKAREPLKGLQEFFNRLCSMGYAERVAVRGQGNEGVLEVTGLADWDAVLEIRHLGYPLVPILTGEIVVAFLDTQFRMATALQPTQLEPERRGLTVKFSFVPKESLIAERVAETPKIQLEEE
ncbi:MAG: hypothetical protein ACYDDF_11845 [Thermoplasmatota archaeon]